MRPATTVSILALSGCLEAGAVLGQNCPGLQTEHEPNDTAATASPIVLSNPSFDRFAGISGSVGVPGDVDWYTFTAPVGARLWLSVDTGVPSSGTRDSVVSIFAADGATLIEEDDDDGTGNGRDLSIESLDASLVANRVLSVGGTYYARVRAKNPADVLPAYSILIAVKTGVVVPEIEPNDVQPMQPLDFNPVLGSLSSAADVDWYAVNVLDNGIPFVVVDGDPERDGIGTDITLLFDGMGTIITDSSGVGTASNPPAEGFATWSIGWARVTGTGPGTYMIGGWQSGDLCPIPVELQSFEVE